MTVHLTSLHFFFIPQLKRFLPPEHRCAFYTVFLSSQNASGFFFCFCFCCRPFADSPPDKITVILLLVIHYPQPCGAVFTIKILSHVATAAPIHLMSGFKEQLKALLRQLYVFDAGELDIPTDLEHSPKINTVVWRLTCRAPYSLNAEIHTASMKVPRSLPLPLSPLPTSPFIHSLLFSPPPSLYLSHSSLLW